MKQIILLCYLLIMLYSPAYGTTFTSACKNSANIYYLNGTLINNATVRIVIKTVFFDEKLFPYIEPLWWGAEFNPPKTITKHIKVIYDGNDSWIRFSAYSDLTNINKVELIILKAGFHIAIDGGEASTHYIANLYFDNYGFLIRKKVNNATFPDEVWEETDYSFIRRIDV